MNKSELLNYVQDKYVEKNQFPEFKGGDTITVTYKIIEGKQRNVCRAFRE